jgi:eukaryotic-like serine/threonine-protein kinase
MTGTTIGRYELLEKLGEGGMGVVYRARDVLLNRSAAIKLLSSEAPLDEDRKRRFLQEAQAASALNHPNIITVYDAGLSGPQDFIAMEYVHGSTLDALLQPDGLPLKDALSYGIQIADALAAAHAAGITHRDIKPGNIMVADRGHVKVLDFGLAKLDDLVTRTPSEISRTIPMRQAQNTVQGTIVGTVAYMAPEQAEGKRVDHRSDIFAFGAVLYEMLTGHRAFSGDSAITTLAAIVHVEAEDVARQVKGVPREVNRVLRRCLEKSPDQRWQSMADVRIALEDVRQDLQSGVFDRPVSANTRKAARISRWLAGAAVGIVALALAGIVMWRQTPASGPPERYAIRGLTFDVGANVSPAISPDGKLIAYSSDRGGGEQADIWLQQIAGGDPVRLTNSMGLAHDPVFSPDGSRIAFRAGASGNGIYVTSALGGTSRRIGDGSWPHWAPDGNQISFVNGNRIVIVPLSGGTQREITTKGNVNGRALWLPGGKYFLYYGVREGADRGNDWYTVSTAGGEELSAGAAGWFKNAGLELPRAESLTTEGVLVVSGSRDSANVYRVPFDFTARRVTGPPVAITVAPGLSFWPSSSADGRKIVFASAGRLNTNVWQIPVDHAKGVVSGQPRAVTEGLEERLAPDPSRDGIHVVYKSGAASPVDIRVRNLTSGQETKLAEVSAATPPVISDDGAQVAYAVDEDKHLSIYTVPLGGGVPRRICKACGRPIQWFANGTRVLYDRGGPGRNSIGVLEIATGRTTILLRHAEWRLFTPRLSPDGRLLCFTAITGPSQRRTYIVPFSPDRETDPKAWTLLQSGSNFERQPIWAPNGQIIYFLSERDGFRCIWGLRMDRATLKPVGDTFAVKHFHQFRHSLLDYNDVADIGFSVAGNNMFLAIREIQSNIWLAERQVQEKRDPRQQ